MQSMPLLTGEMYSTVAANNRAYGADIVPVSYDDIFLAETIFIIGSNTADNVCINKGINLIGCIGRLC
jgi:anaerobic selenocysteine-containing dehydrogenase